MSYKVIDGRLRFEGKRKRRPCPVCGQFVGPHDYIYSYRFIQGLGRVCFQMCRECRDKELDGYSGDTLLIE
jgi:hypothetical protein